MIYPKPNYIARTIEHYCFDGTSLILQDSFTGSVLDTINVEANIKSAIWLGGCLVDFGALLPDVLSKRYKHGVRLDLYNPTTIRAYFSKRTNKTHQICAMITEMLFMDGSDYLELGFWEFYLD